MSWNDVLSAAQGGLQGYVGERRRREDRDFEEKKLAQQGEIQKLKEDIRVMLAEMNEGGRMQRHVTPSGNAIVQEQGDSERASLNYHLGLQRDDTSRRGQDLNYDVGMQRDDTTRRGQDLDHDEFGDMNDRLWRTATMGDDRAKERNWLTERGQDINRGQNNQRFQLDAYETAHPEDPFRMPGDAPTRPPLSDWMSSPDAPPAPPAPPSVMGRRPPQSPVAPPQRPAQAPAPGARPPVPGDRPAQSAAGQGRYRVGQTVTLRDGRQVTIKRILPDGRFEY